MELPKHLDLRHLSIFVAVAETRSMATAAERFSVTQAAVSQAVARLERAVGCDLLDRSTRPFRLTAAGTYVERHGRDIVTHASVVHRALTRGAGLAVPELRLSIVDSFISATMPELLSRLAEQISTDRIVLLSGLTDSNIAALRDGNVDGAITTDAVEISALMPSQPILRERFVAVAPRDAQETDIHELATRRHFIGFPPFSPMGRQIKAHFGRAKLPLDAHTILDRPELALGAVANGHGWTIATPLCLAASALAPETLKVIRIARNPGWRSVAFVTRPHELTHANSAIARIARETAAAILPDRLYAHAQWLPGEIEFSEGTSTSSVLE